MCWFTVQQAGKFEIKWLESGKDLLSVSSNGEDITCGRESGRKNKWELTGVSLLLYQGPTPVLAEPTGLRGIHPVCSPPPKAIMVASKF